VALNYQQILSEHSYHRLVTAIDVSKVIICWRCRIVASKSSLPSPYFRDIVHPVDCYSYLNSLFQCSPYQKHVFLLRYTFFECLSDPSDCYP